MSTIAGFGPETDIDLLCAIIHVFPPHLMRKLLSRTKHTKRRERRSNYVCALVTPPPCFPLMQLSTVKMESVNVATVSPGGGKLDIATKDVPVVHTEIKTITYESSQVRLEAWPLCGVMHSRVTTQ